MGPVLSYVVQLVLGILIPWAIVRFDMKHLSPERLDHAWPEVSFWMSIIAFGPFCLPFHFVKTRKNWFFGLLLGLLAFLAALVALVLLGSAVDSIIALFE